MWNWLVRLIICFLEWFAPDRKVVVREGDTLPARLPLRDLVLLKDDGEDWSIGLRCPCGCGDTIELLLLPGVEPRWDIDIDERGRPTLSPSVWKATGCRSHFWVRTGRVVWT